jgi:Xaa-Pro aminopeptidase
VALEVASQPADPLVCPSAHKKVPIATNLVDFGLLSPVERKWLKDHNELCRKALLPLLRGPDDAEARRWLKKQ